MIQDAMIDALPGTTVLTHLEPEERVRANRFEPGDDVAPDPTAAD